MSHKAEWRINTAVFNSRSQIVTPPINKQAKDWGAINCENFFCVHEGEAECINNCKDCVLCDCKNCHSSMEGTC